MRVFSSKRSAYFHNLSHAVLVKVIGSDIEDVTGEYKNRDSVVAKRTFFYLR